VILALDVAAATPGGDPDTAMVDAFTLGFALNCRKADPR